MHLDDPLASPWATARSICLWTTLGSWVVLLANDLTAKLDWINDAAPVVAVLAAFAVFPVQLLGRMKLKRLTRTAEEMAKEMERLGHPTTDGSA